MQVYILTCNSSYCDIKSTEILGVYDSEDKAFLNKSIFEDLYKNASDIDYAILLIEEQEIQ